MSLTSTFDVPVGTVTFSINTSTTEVMNVESVSNIKYEYDVGTGQATVDRLFAIYSTIDIELFQYSVTGTDLFTYLINETATKRTVDMTIEGHAGSTYRFRFSLEQDSIKYKASTKKITLLCSPIQPTDTVEVVFNSASAGDYFPVTFDTGSTIGASGIGALNFVSLTLNKVNPNLTSIYASYPAQGIDLSSDGYMYLDGVNLPILGEVYGIIYKQIGGDTLSGIAIETLKRMAAIEGGIIGTGFDNNFYIQRLSTTYSTSLNDSEVEEVSFEYGYKPYASIGVTLLSGILSNLDTAPVLESYDNQALKKMDIQFPIPYLNKAEYETFGGIGDAFSPDIVTLSDYEASLANNGVSSYVAAFGADRRLVVDVTVLGFDRIKPYQMVVFNTGTEFPTPFNGKYFRPTSLEYDLYQNKVKAKLYYVADV